jgi:hypothetical protein
MACAVGGSSAKKILIPVNKCDISIAGATDRPYAEYVRMAAEMIVEETKKFSGNRAGPGLKPEAGP